MHEKAKHHPSISRRRLLGYGATAAGIAAASRVGIVSAAQDAVEPSGSVTFLSAENLLGRWDPYNNSNLAHLRLQAAAFDYLVFRDENNAYVPGLATAWSNIDDAQWEFTLREGVQFHDGSPLTVEDVKASLEYSSNPETISAFYFGGQIEVEKVDDLTFRLHTPTPFAPLLASLSNGQGATIVRAADIESGAINDRFNGTGPFSWVDYAGEETGVHLTANTEWWGGSPRIKDYFFRYVGDSNTRLAALQTGEAQIIDRVEPDQVVILEGDPNTAVVRTKTVESKWIAFRATVPPFKDNPQLRKAIAHAIDVPTIVDNIMLGSGEVKDSYLTSTEMFYKSNPNYPQYDTEKAKELLAEAGYPNGEGLPELTFIVSVGFYPKTKEYGEYIVSNLADVGVKCVLQPMEVAAWNQALYVADAGHMIDHGWFVPSPDPHTIFSSLFGGEESIITHVSDPGLNDLIVKQQSAFDEAERARVIQEELDPALIDACYEYSMFTTELITGISAALKGFSVPPTSEHRIEKAYLEE